MGSSRGEDQCLGGGISLPQWIKGRGDVRYDFDHSSFSPPSHDDNFFCIRYSANAATEKSANDSATDNGQRGYRPISQVLSANTSSKVNVSQVESTSACASSDIPNTKDKKNIDFSKHPLPCQPFIPAAGGKEVKPATIGSANKIKVAKSQGTDDGFHSGPALCGKSIVHVANRMMSRKLATIDSANESPEGYKNNASMEEQRNEKQLSFRKGSKSLPVTPIASPTSTPDTSPKSRRRGNTNRYFAGSFTPEQRDNNKYQAGWLLASIFSQSRELGMGAGNMIQEVDEDEAPPLDLLPSKFLNRKKSISSQNLSYVGRSEDSQQQRDAGTKKETNIYRNVFGTKPAEIREMNFWSPTSM